MINLVTLKLGDVIDHITFRRVSHDCKQSPEIYRSGLSRLSWIIQTTKLGRGFINLGTLDRVSFFLQSN